MKEAQTAASATKLRKPRFKKEYTQQAYKLCLLGATDIELAKFFDVTPEVLSRWKKNHEEFGRQITKGKKAADMEVVLSLYQASIDRIVTTKQPIKCKEVYYDDNRKRGEVVAEENKRLEGFKNRNLGNKIGYQRKNYFQQNSTK